MISHPSCAVVNLGLGLNTTFFRTDNDKIEWYNVDFQNVIDFRQKVSPRQFSRTQHRRKCAVIRLTTEVDFNKSEGAFFIAGGLFIYFSEKQIQNLLQSIAKMFPGSELIFDGSSKLGVQLTDKKMEKQDIKGMKWKYYVESPEKKFSQWHERIQVKEVFDYWEKTNIKKKVDFDHEIIDENLYILTYGQICACKIQ